MDEQSATSDNKMRLLEAEDINNGIRSIDDLPEEILVHIISFLCLEDAIGTSVLSKKWEFLWTSIPDLEFFGNFNGCNIELFTNFVDRVVLLHDCSPIKKFCLCCKGLSDDRASRMNEWFTAAAKRGVEVFTVSVGYFEESPLPCCLFTCETLVELHVDLMCTLSLPSQVHLPNLKYLFLSNVNFSDECSTQSLFSSPALESLTLTGCRWDNLRAITISNPKLGHLSLGPGSTFDFRGQIMIRDCNLESLKLEGPRFNDYLVSNLSAVNVTLVSAFTFRWSLDQDPSTALKNVLQKIRAVRNLSFRLACFYVFEDTLERTFYWSDFPIFVALNTLAMRDLGRLFGVLVKLLHCTPHLQTLIVHRGLEDDSEDEDNGYEEDKVLDQAEDACDVEGDEVFDQVPQCFSSSLKKIKIGGLLVKRGELSLLKLMLKYTMILEEIVIFSPCWNYKFENFCRTLMRCPRGSKNCVINASNDYASVGLGDFHNYW